MSCLNAREPLGGQCWLRSGCSSPGSPAVLRITLTSLVVLSASVSAIWPNIAMSRNRPAPAAWARMTLRIVGRNQTESVVSTVIERGVSTMITMFETRCVPYTAKRSCVIFNLSRMAADFQVSISCVNVNLRVRVRAAITVRAGASRILYFVSVWSALLMLSLFRNLAS